MMRNVYRDDTSEAGHVQKNIRNESILSLPSYDFSIRDRRHSHIGLQNGERPVCPRIVVPYGGERAYTNTCAQNYKFEGKERDTETQNDDFGARYYSWRFGRWLSADWSAVPAPVPYANLANPQTLNLYSMVADDPETFADLDGHMFWAPFLGNGPIGDISFLIASGAGPSENSQGLSYFGSADPENDPNQNQSQNQNQAQNTGTSAAPAPYVTPGTADARNALLGILNSNNSCSQFFDGAAAKLPGADGASAAQIFSAVDIRLSPGAPASEGASTQQGSGKEGPIFVNPSGPFFKSSGIVDFKMTSLNVASGFPGGEPRTQKLILAHELGHKVGAIPSDSGDRGKSNRNTETIIKYCRKELGQ
jgi:RHS repeat-associated protein